MLKELMVEIYGNFQEVYESEDLKDETFTADEVSCVELGYNCSCRKVILHWYRPHSLRYSFDYLWCFFLSLQVLKRVRVILRTTVQSLSQNQVG